MRLRVAHDRAVRRVGSLIADSRGRERFGIGPVRVTVIALEKYRAVRKNFVEIFFVRQSFGAEHGVVPAPPQHPIFARMFCRVVAQALLNIGGILCAFKIHAAEAQGAIQKVNVAIDKSWEHQAATSVDYFRAGSAQLFDFRIFPYGNDPGVGNGHRLRPRMPGIESEHLAMSNDRVGGARRLRENHNDGSKADQHNRDRLILACLLHRDLTAEFNLTCKPRTRTSAEY